MNGDLVEEAEHLPAGEPPPGLLVVHDPVRRRQHDVPELLCSWCFFGGEWTDGWDKCHCCCGGGDLGLGGGRGGAGGWTLSIVALFRRHVSWASGVCANQGIESVHRPRDPEPAAPAPSF